MHSMEINFSNRPSAESNINTILVYISEINDTIEELDLSWNHLRFDGADGIATGLAVIF